MLSSVFDTLPPRPPTPPKDISSALDDAINFLDDSNEIEQRLKQSRGRTLPSDDTVPHSPATSQSASGECSTSKKVDFSPHLNFHKLSSTGQHSSPGVHAPKRKASAQHAKPLRSILKLSSVPPPLTPDDLETKLGYFSPENPGAFPKMLQSVIQQLAGPSTTSRLDAYLTLNGALKAYEDVPDPQAMIAKMSLLMQFITRDMPWRGTGDLMDTRLVDQVLKLTNAILYDSRLSVALDDDFRTFVLDRSIAVLELVNMPKSIVKAHLFILAQQRFQKSIMTAGRADKLVTALHTIEERCSGNNAVATRLVIYQRLLEKAPAVMANRVRDFLEHVFHGMLSSLKEVRVRAIETCTVAGTVLGTHSPMTKALEDILNTEDEEGQPYFVYLSLRLTSMISDKETGPFVPQIWSSIMLFFRNKGRPLEKWSKMRNWLFIIQKCLNASDLNTKYQAHLAWNKLVLAILPGSSTSRNMFSMLMLPIAAGLDKKGGDKHSKQSRQCALDSYYNLLHYSLRPGLTNEELDSAWDAYVEPALSNMIKSGSRGRHLACGILSGLFTRSSGVWNANAANETAPIKPQDLPRLDPRWARSRLSRPLKLVQPMLHSTMWLSTEVNAAVDQTLNALIESIAEAGSQEVKTSNELKDAVALVVDMFRRIWQGATRPSIEAEEDAWVERYGSLVKMVIKGVGRATFAEDILTKTKDDTVEAATTPSHRASKHHSAPQAPLVILFGLLYQPPSTLAVDPSFFGLAQDLLDIVISCRSSMLARLELINRSLQIWSLSPSSTNPLLVGRLWGSVARCAEQVIHLGEPHAQSHGSQQFGHGMRDAANILVRGIKYAAADAPPMDSMMGLYRAMSQSAAATAGSSGQVVAVIEPLAKALLADTNAADDAARLALASRMLSASCWPRSRLEMDQARKAIWGVALAPQRAVVFDPYEHLYRLVSALMVSTYGKLDGVDDADSEPLLGFVASCMVFLRACPTPLLAAALRKMQSGFVAWVEDESRSTAANGLIDESVLTSWQEILRLLRSLPQQDTSLLKGLEPLIVAGFVSPHRAVVNATISFWNETFGCQTTLEYPAKIEGVLRARLVETDLVLPDFPESNPQNETISLPPFYESQHVAQSSSRPSSSAGAISHISATAPVVQTARLNVPASRFAGGSSPVSMTSRLSGSSTPKARLRHDDSQIQFAMIDSSPIRVEDESQHLTEHQRDVRDRQLATGQMFPDLSSSPMPQRSLQKRLNFSTDIGLAQLGAGGTPKRLQALDLPMSDDLPSSPTPSSARRSVTRMDLDKVDVHAEAMEDPPSSPPRAHDDDYDDDDDDDDEVGIRESEPLVSEMGPDATTILSTDHNDGGLDGDAQVEDDNDEGLPKSYGPGESAGADDLVSDLPSDTLLPTAQLQDEEKVASDDRRLAEHATRRDENGDKPPAPRLSQDDDGVEAAVPTDMKPEPEVTRVEDSFVEAVSSPQADIRSIDGSQQSQRSNRKRKRPSSTVYSAKKRKQQSPFKRFFSGIMGRSQEDEDDDIGDEIVVASSQMSSSPVHLESQDAATDVSQQDEPSAVKPEQPAELPKAPKLAADQLAKRGRGRPRKSETPTPAPASSQSDAYATRSLKRRASALSVSNDVEMGPPTSVVKDTPAPRKARKQREGPDALLVREASTSQESLATSRLGKRAMAGVVIPQGQGSEEVAREKDHTEADSGDDQDVGPESQLVEEAATALSQRPVTTPKSFIGHLRGLLSALPGMVLGSREEREVDDLLFEIKKEVHEAGRRGRA